MTVTLPTEIAQIITDQIAQGRFDTPEEAVAESVRIFVLYAGSERLRLEFLRAEIDKGYDSLQQYGTVSYDPNDTMRRVRERLAQESSGHEL